MKLALKLALSLLIGVVCAWYAFHGTEWSRVWDSMRALPLGAVALYLVTLALTHLFRAWRWEYLLRPLGVTVPLKDLMPISSVGFMAILALPVRLGEFVRPYYIARGKRVRMSAALGTVAVERILDGLMVSIVFFVAYLASGGSTFSSALRFGAWLSLLGFLGLTTFLALALAWTDATIALALRVTLLKYLAPNLSTRIADKLRSLISGFRALADLRNMSLFMLQSVLYWGFNGFGMWILARAMGLDIPVGAAYATMAFTGVVLCLPNSPGLLGQFHGAIRMSLLAFLPVSVVNSSGVAYAIVLHGIQVVWYVVVGFISLAVVSRGDSQSFALALRESKRAAEEAEAA